MRSARAQEGTRGSSFIVTRPTAAIAHHLYIAIHHPANSAVSLGSNQQHNS
jgi:hypothetical protein